MAVANDWTRDSERLEEDEIAALAYVFGDMETAVGIRSTYAAQVDRLQGVRGGTRMRENLMPVEYWACWSTKGRRRSGLIAYRALRRLADTPEGARHVAVLYRTYGPMPPGPRLDELGDVGRIAALTDTAAALAKTTEHKTIGEALYQAVSSEFPRTMGKTARKQADAERAALNARLRVEGSQLVTAATKAFRATRDALIVEARRGR